MGKQGESSWSKGAKITTSMNFYSLASCDVNFFRLVELVLGTIDLQLSLNLHFFRHLWTKNSVTFFDRSWRGAAHADAARLPY